MDKLNKITTNSIIVFVTTFAITNSTLSSEFILNMSIIDSGPFILTGTID